MNGTYETWRLKDVEILVKRGRTWLQAGLSVGFPLPWPKVEEIEKLTAKMVKIGRTTEATFGIVWLMDIKSIDIWTIYLPSGKLT